MKISLDAAMRARDVSQPTAADEIAAADLGIESRIQVAEPAADPPGQGRRPQARPRPWHRQGSAGSSPESS